MRSQLVRTTAGFIAAFTAFGYIFDNTPAAFLAFAWVTLFGAVVVGYYIVTGAVTAIRLEKARLIREADQQHSAMCRGDDEYGTHGVYPITAYRNACESGTLRT